MLTFALIAAAACAPRTPPAGSLDISSEVGVQGTAEQAAPLPLPTPTFSGPVPLPIGQARPFEGEPTTEAQRAFVEAEEALDQLSRGLEEAMSSSAVLAVTEQAEQIQELLKLASTEAALAGPAAVRMGDALRLADQACLATDELPAPDDPGAIEREAARAEACAPLGEGALTTYRAALELNAPDTPWHRHAQWAIGVLAGG